MLYSWEGKPQAWRRVPAAYDASGALVYMTNVTAACLPMKPEIAPAHTVFLNE